LTGQTVKAEQKSGRKQQQRSIRTQEKLLDAALLAFAENGFKGTSTRDIAERAGVHHPLITYHFKNKEALWRAATDRVFQKFVDVIDHVRQEHGDSPALDRVAALIRAYVHFAAENPEMHKVMFQESGHMSPRMEWLINSYLRPMYDKGLEDLVTLQQQGIAPPGDPALLYNVIRVSAGALLALRIELKGTSNLELDTPEQLDALADLIIYVFLSGHRQEKRGHKTVNGKDAST
jgi:AcrR family transcriptional regulator